MQDKLLTLKLSEYNSLTSKIKGLEETIKGTHSEVTYCKTVDRAIYRDEAIYVTNSEEIKKLSKELNESVNLIESLKEQNYALQYDCDLLKKENTRLQKVKRSFIYKLFY